MENVETVKKTRGRPTLSLGQTVIGKVMNYIQEPARQKESQKQVQARIEKKFGVTRSSAKVYLAVARNRLGISRKYTKKADQAETSTVNS